MTTTVFVNGATLTDADWFNDLNRLHYTILADPADVAAVRVALGLVIGTNVQAYSDVRFRAYQSTLNSVTSSNDKITLDAETFDTAGCFAASRFTPTTAGYYQINGAIQFATGSYTTRAAIYKNGSIYSYGVSSASQNTASVSDTVYLSGAGDYVELFGYSATTQNTQTGTTNTYFSGALI